MAAGKSKFQTVDEYIGMFPKEVQAVLESVRETVGQAEPEAEEVISYQLPALKYRGKNLIFYSAYTNHYSVAFSPPFTIFEVFREELSPFEVGKTSVQFPLDQPIPSDLLRKMVQYKVEEISKTSKKK